MDIIRLKLKMFLYHVLKKDSMDLKIAYCREKGVIIGENMRAFSMPISSEPFLLKFGNNITISGEVKFITHDNSVIKIVSHATDTVGRVIIGDNCFLGYRSLFLPGIELGNNTIVAAGSVVTKSFKQGNIVIGGNPAKIICSIEDYRNRIEDNVFDFKGKNYEQKRQMILNNEHKYLSK